MHLVENSRKQWRVKGQASELLSWCPELEVEQEQIVNMITQSQKSIEQNGDSKQTVTDSVDLVLMFITIGSFYSILVHKRKGETWVNSTS